MRAVQEFRSKLSSGCVCIGASVTFADPLVSDALADSVDFLWLDLEHAQMSPEATAGHLLAARSRGVPTVVRVSGSATPFIKPVLDAGAEAIVVPQVSSVEEVRSVVRDCRYPPLGRRGYGPRVPSNYGRDGGDAYVERANRSLFVAVQIETKEALDSLDDILKIEGLDSLFIGPWDLSGALGVLGDVEHPTVVAAIESIIARTKAAGLYIGAGMGADSDYARVMADRGVQWLQVGCDFGYLVNEADRIVTAIRTR